MVLAARAIYASRREPASPAWISGDVAFDAFSTAFVMPPLLAPPLQLELQLLVRPRAFVLDVERDIGRNAKSFSGHLNSKRLGSLDGVCQSAQFRHEL